MDSADAALLKEIDPAQLGDRLRAARVAKGWTQTQLAGEHISVGYVSRIESGQRRPNAAVLDDMATRLGLPVDHLLRGVTAREYDEIKLTLDFAELSLESGQHVEAETQARQALDRALVGSQDELAFRARYLIARVDGEPRLHGRRHPRARAAGRLARGRHPADQVRHRAQPVLPRVRRPREGDRGRRAGPGAADGHSARQLRRGRADGGHPGGCLQRARRLGPGRTHLPQGHHQGRGAVVTDRAGIGVLEREHLRGSAGVREQRRAPGRARPGPALRGSRRPQPRQASQPAGHDAAPAGPARHRRGTGEPRQGRRGAGLVAAPALSTSPTTNSPGHARSSSRAGRPTPPTSARARCRPSTSTPRLLAADVRHSAGTDRVVTR